jgi:hypothetical protein
MLGCLAAAMTGTSALLGWMDPSSTSAYERPLAEILSDARQAVSSRIGVRPSTWRSIEVLAGPVAGRSGTLLAASLQTGEFHFQIGLDGRILPTENWIDQGFVSGKPGSVRMEIVRIEREGPMTRAQWDCVRALVTVLRESPTYHAADLPVRLDPVWTDVYGLSPDAQIHVGPLAVDHR